MFFGGDIDVSLAVEICNEGLLLPSDRERTRDTLLAYPRPANVESLRTPAALNISISMFKRETFVS